MNTKDNHKFYKYICLGFGEIAKMLLDNGADRDLWDK